MHLRAALFSTASRSLLERFISHYARRSHAPTLQRLATLIAACFLTHASIAAPLPASSNGIEDALERAGTNRAQISRGLVDVPETQRAGMQFLIRNMPDSDLQTLSSSFLLEDLALAYQAFSDAPWRERISNEMFLNEILPYACMTETRESWRKKLHDLSQPLITECKSPGEAAQRLNQKLFKLVKVRYSTDRKKPDQSPL